MRNFKSAFKTSLLFLLIVVTVSAIIMYPYFHSETYHYQDGYVRKSLAGQLDLVICGASQAQRGISTAILDEELGCSSYNLGTPLMTMQGRYYILKQEVERNPVKLVLIELCYDTLCRDRDVVGAEGDYYTLGRFTSFFDRAAYFFASARLEEYADFYYDALHRGITAWKSRGNNAIGTSANYVTKGFTPLETHPIEMPEPENYNQEEILTQAAEENVKYLNKIFELCRDHDIPVIVISTPLSDAAILSYDKLDVINEMYHEICAQWDCEYYNFSLYKGKSELLPDSDSFFDRNHLSEDGANKFSYILSSVVSDSIAGLETHDLFYDSYAQAQSEGIIPYHEQTR